MKIVFLTIMIFFNNGQTVREQLPISGMGTCMALVETTQVVAINQPQEKAAFAVVTCSEERTKDD